MIKDIQILLTPEQAAQECLYTKIIAKKLAIDMVDITGVEIIKRSIDARKKAKVKILLTAKVYVLEPLPKDEAKPVYANVADRESVVIVGSGPAGLFAAIRLIELNLKPIILERGKCVKERALDVAKINKYSIVDGDSNYAFGEGGAGTFSDGKLFTRSKKRGNVSSVLQILLHHGADKKIMVDAHPHIGTNKLPRIIENIRQTILNAGGEIYFNHRVDGLLVDKSKIYGVTVGAQKFLAKAVILATGHSARDIYLMLHKDNIILEPKTFAVGVRVEHQQSLIDSIQYHCIKRDKYLPAATYSLVAQVDGRGVYSFCMCPGGFIVPASTANDEIVVNGMSPSKRNSKYANSGIVVQINPEDLSDFQQYGVLAGLEFQKHLEHLCFEHGNKSQSAPAQRMLDFVEGKSSVQLNNTSYQPGLIASDMHKWLPTHISKRLQVAFKLFDNKMKGYLTNDAQLIGVESRTSSPLRIPRDKNSLEHINIKRLYPTGEGAGYAGGIVSAAVDGQRVAEAIASQMI